VESLIALFFFITLTINNQAGRSQSENTEREEIKSDTIYYNDISSGYNHVCALNNNNELKCWGSGVANVLGYASDRSTPGSIPGTEFETLKTISSGWNNTCFINVDGSLKCIGSNFDSQLGNPEFDRETYGNWVQVKGMEQNVEKVSIGRGAMCALMNSGDVYCWGADWSTYDYLNPNNVTIRDEPVQIMFDEKVIDINLNGLHACAITETNKIACWGYGEVGQLGNGSFESQSEPVYVSDLEFVSKLDLGVEHTCAIGKASELEPEKLWCWGSNSYGKLGVDPEEYVITPGIPHEVNDIPGQVIEVGAGAEHTCAIVKNEEKNSVYCWGLNREGQLGIGSTSEWEPMGDLIGPTLVPGTEGAIKINLGESHTTILKESGQIQSWGKNTNGQLGNGAFFRRQLPIHLNSTYPILEQPIEDIVFGDYFTCTLMANGSVYCWGGNWYGQVGKGDLDYAAEPVKIFDSGVKAITATEDMICSILMSSEIKCWGINYDNRLGTDIDQPILSTPAYVLNEDGTNFTGAIGFSNSKGYPCVINEENNILCWGYYKGQYPDVEVITYPSPIDQFGDENIISYTSSRNHSCFVNELGDVYCWGFNYNGELGLGYADYELHTTPTKVESLNADIIEVSATKDMTCALSSLREVYCWGGGSYFMYTPQKVDGLNLGVDSISTNNSYISYSHTCVILQGSRSVKCFGDNNYSQLGDGTYRFYGDIEPVDVLGLEGNVKKVRVCGASSCAIFDSGAAACWGFDYQLETSPVNLVEVDELDQPPSVFFSNYYSGSPESYFVITGLYYTPNQYYDIAINGEIRGRVYANETGVFKFFTFFEEIGEYKVKILPVIDTIKNELTNNLDNVKTLLEVSQNEIIILIEDENIQRIKEGDGYTILLSDNTYIFLPLINR
jgi:alpha-tubulin suppressor-like RCC1 family protein